MTRTTRSLVGNILLAGFLVLVVAASLRFLNMWNNASRDVDAWTVVLVVVAAVSAGLRWWPLVSFGVCTIAVSVYLFIGYPYGPILLCLVVATYTLARRVRLRVAVIAAAVGLCLLLSHVFTHPSALDGLWALLPGSAWIVVPFTIGLTRRLIVEGAARQRAESERRALDGERLRLASEVHDIVGHGLAAIQMQADIALHIRDRKPEQADIALDAISRASAEALAELRATLAAVAPDDTTASRESRAPTPGLARIEALCARMRESGIHIDLTITGEQRAVDRAVDVAAYRVIQESLTNVAKHAAARHASIEIRYDPDAVRVEITNPRESGGPVDEGFGIAGMRRRVDAVGGEFSLNADGHEFQVVAVFPA